MRRRGGASNKSKGEDGDGDMKVLDMRNDKAGWCRRAVGLVYSFVLIHYLFWGLIAAAVLVWMFRRGPLGAYLSIGMVLLYVPTFLNPVQKKLGRPWDAFRQLGLWKLTQEYLKLRIVRTKKLDPEKGPYLFGFHPHGIIILSRVATYGGAWESMFPGIEQRTLGASPMFYLPGIRDLSLWMGAVDASKHVAEGILRAGKSLIIYPGGSKEIFETIPTSKVTRLVLKSRKGFLKLAMKYGTPLVPTFVFGEKWRFSRFIFPQSLVRWALKTLKMPLLLFWGRFGTLLPLQHENGLGVVYGEPMQLPHTDSPTDEQLEEAMTAYCKQVEGLFLKYKAEFGYAADETLEIV